MKTIKRISSYTEARNMAKEMLDDDTRRSNSRALVEGQIAGNLPYNPKELKAKGQGYRSNVNFRELEGSTKARIGSFIRLLFDTHRLVDVLVTDYEEKANLRYYYATIIQEELHRLFKRDFRFFFSFARAMRNMVVHGPGILYWPTAKEYLPKAAKPGKVQFSKNSDEDPTEYDVVAITDDLSWDMLFSLIESPDKQVASESVGWRLDVVKSLIDQLNSKESSDSLARLPETPEEFELLEAKRSSYTIEEGRPQSIEVTHIYSKEASGKVTKAIIIRNDDLDKEIENLEDRYLYYKHEEFECFDEVMIVVMTEVGNDGIHSVRGYGHKVYPHAVTSNRMLNTALDGAMLASTVVVQAPTGTGKSMADIIRLGPITVIDADQKVVTGALNANITPVVQMRDVLNANMANSFGATRPQSEGGNSGYKTARQTDYEMVKSNALANLEVLTFYMFADRVYEMIVKKMYSSRLSNKAEKKVALFKERCISRGVPEWIIEEQLFEVTSSRVIGNGSLEMLLTMTREMLAVAPYLEEEGKRNVIRDYIVARVGAENAERYMPVLSDDNLTNLSRQMARFETNDMLAGYNAVVSAYDDHVYHLKEHLQATETYYEAFVNQQIQMTAVDMMNFLASSISHITEHIAYIQGELNKPLLDEMLGALQNIKVLHKQMQNAARQEMAQNEEQERERQEIMAKAMEQLQGKDTQLQMARINEDAKIKYIKTQADLDIRARRAEHGMGLDEAKVAAKIRAIDAETNAKLNNARLN